MEQHTTEAGRLIGCLPWPRLVHFYGRCTDFPERFRQLTDEDAAVRRAAARRLLHDIEHQDGLIAATPFTLQVLMRLMAEHTDVCGEILAVVLRVAQVCDETVRHLPQSAPAHSLDFYLQPDVLWPDCISDEEDEMLWEEWELPPEALDDFVLLCIGILRQGADILRGLNHPQAEAVLQCRHIFGAV